MKVAILAPVSWRVPPEGYGPWELFCSLLTEGLVKKGIDVTLFATKDSKTNAYLEAVVPRPLEIDKNLNPQVWTALHIANCFEKARQFDLIHNSLDFLPLTYSGSVKTPVVTTIHGFSSDEILPVYKKYNEITYYVSISDADRNPELNYLATIHHGIEINDFPFVNDPDEYLMFFGRIHPDKGTKEAIEVAKQSNRKLKIAGIVHDQQYFKKHVEPHIDAEQIEYLGHLDREEGIKVLSHASALLHLINFDEPFGFSMVEAMATGTPVIAFPRGSVREVVNDSYSGYVVKDVDEAVDKINELEKINRKQVREWVKSKFSVDEMIEAYVKVYQKILKF